MSTWVGPADAPRLGAATPSFRRRRAAATTRLRDGFALARGVELLLAAGRAEVVAHAAALARAGRARRVNRHPADGVDELLFSRQRRFHNSPL
jgi:hypothetical protein